MVTSRAESGAGQRIIKPTGWESPRESESVSTGIILAREYNIEGDRMDNVAILINGQIPKQRPRRLPSAADISSGYGAAQIAAFVEQEEARKVMIIGGLPTNFDTLQETPDMISAVRSIFLRDGGEFLVLPNHSQYPPADFFNSEDHLTSQCQFLHSVLMGYMLAGKLHRHAIPPPQKVLLTAAACPSGPTNFAELLTTGAKEADVQNNF